MLDWLAKFLTSGQGEKGTREAWSLKKLHRLIATSATYRQGSAWNEQPAKIDPDNKLLWRVPRRRLSAEMLRDSFLAVSGQLSLKEGGTSVFPELPAELKKSAKNWKPSPSEAERNRRSVYIAVRRNLRYPLLAAFDAPDASETCGRRFATTTAPQALMLLNDQLVQEIAKKLAKRVEKEAGHDNDAVINTVCRLALGRLPDSSERETMKRFLERPGDRDQTVADLCHAVMNLNEFLFVE